MRKGPNLALLNKEWIELILVVFVVSDVRHCESEGWGEAVGERRSAAGALHQVSVSDQPWRHGQSSVSDRSYHCHAAEHRQPVSLLTVCPYCCYKLSWCIIY